MKTEPNLLDQDFTATAPNQRWVADTTELRTPTQKLFLAVVMDLYSRRIVGWALGKTNDRFLTLRALDAALGMRRPMPGLLHHSDKGATYTASEYRARLEEHCFICSMSGVGNCFDNAAMESWNGTLKCELGEDFESLADANTKLFDYIECFYNPKRRHSTLGYLSPMQFEGAARQRAA
jgi:transposase InsO family protein